MELFFELWLIVLIIGAIVLLFLLSIDIIEAFEVPIILSFLCPPVALIALAMIAIVTMYNACRKNKAKIRKFLRLKNRDI